MYSNNFHSRFLPNQHFYKCLYKKVDFNKKLFIFLLLKNKITKSKIKFLDSKITNNTSMGSSPLLVNFLIFIVKIFNIKSFLEIGTYVGLTSLSLAPFFGRSKTRKKNIVSIEKYSKFYDLALENFKINKKSDLIDIRLGKAINVLSTLKQKFDLIFLDGGKNEYFQTFIQLEKYQIKKGTIIIVDDMFYHGSVLNKKKIIEAKSILNLTNYVFSKKKYEAILLPFFGGVLFIKVLK